VTAIPTDEQRSWSLRRWEFYTLVFECFLLVAAEGVVWGVLRHQFSVPKTLSAGLLFAMIELTLVPVQTAIARLHYAKEVSGARLSLWTLAVAATATALATAFWQS
jgi:hypothetical protein